MTYTQHYWGEFAETLGAPLHHGPTTGTSADKARFDDNYTATKALYEAEFGSPPPEDIWPPAQKRFGDAPFYRRINTRTHLVVPLPGVVRAILARRRIAAAGLTLAAISGLTAIGAQASWVQQESGEPNIRGLVILVLTGVGLAVLLAVLRAMWVNRKGRGDETAGGGGGTSTSDSSADCGDGGGSGCGGGCGGCGGS